MALRVENADELKPAPTESEVLHGIPQVRQHVLTYAQRGCRRFQADWNARLQTKEARAILDPLQGSFLQKLVLQHVSFLYVGAVLTCSDRSTALQAAVVARQAD